MLVNTFNQFTIDKSAGWRVKQFNFNAALACHQIDGKIFILVINFSGAVGMAADIEHGQATKSYPQTDP